MRFLRPRAKIGWVTLLPYLWLGLFFLLPFLLVLRIALSDSLFAQPPFAPTFAWDRGLGGLWADLRALDLENFRFLFSDSLYVKALWSSLRTAFIATLIALLIGYPLAYGMAQAPKAWRTTLLILVILPFWTSFLVRVYAWIAILKNEGLLNHLLISLGLIEAPLALINRPIAVYIGIVYAYLPFMVLPLYAALERLEGSLVEAARDLGCSRTAAFWRVVFPLSLPGVAAGCLLVFIPAVGEFVIPDLLGSSDMLMIGRLLWIEFFNNRDWPLASAVVVLLVVLLVLPLVAIQRRLEQQRGGL